MLSNNQSKKTNLNTAKEFFIDKLQDSIIKISVEDVQSMNALTKVVEELLNEPNNLKINLKIKYNNENNSGFLQSAIDIFNQMQENDFDNFNFDQSISNNKNLSVILSTDTNKKVNDILIKLISFGDKRLSSEINNLILEEDIYLVPQSPSNKSFKTQHFLAFKTSVFGGGGLNLIY